MAGHVTWGRVTLRLADNIAVRVRPHMGVHEGWVIPRGMTRRHGRAIPDKIPVREFLFAGGAGA